MAMDRISKSLLEEFSTDHGIQALPEDQRFERFAAFLVTGPSAADDFDTDDVVTGSGGDTGIDALAIVVNGALVTEPEQVTELVEANSYVDATFIFVQAERSASFDTSKIGQFAFGVEDFFRDKPRLPRNDEVKLAAKIMTAVYAQSSKFKRGNPLCRLFYVTTGKSGSDANIQGRRSAVIDDLKQLGIFREVEFQLVGADGLQKLYNQTKNAVSREITFAERTAAPDIPGIKEAYVGLLPASEFMRLLDDGNGQIMKTIFYDNVRDWQDYNDVNAEMRTSLTSPQHRARFALMNNGVTIIARTMRPTGNKIFVEDYQIVNGCQTSHVLFENRMALDESVYVPLRLISTQDEEVIASIVKATNRQTEVKEEQLIALSDFQKRLEAYFLTFESSRRLYYERRSRQYAAAPGVERTRVVTPPVLIRAHASIFSEAPHRTTRTYRLLLGQLGKAVFGADDKLEPYYYAASASYRVDFLFRNGALDAKYKPARYHILMAARILLNGERPPRANSGDMARYCEPLLKNVWDPDAASKLFERAAKIVAKVAKGGLHRDQVRTEPFTERVREECRK